LSRSGENVVVVGRSPQKTAAVANGISADHFVADFAELDQVRELARNRYPRIDVLANQQADDRMLAEQLWDRSLDMVAMPELPLDPS
jgi:NAD(P)-dependent dehydrogenase (short-subunit alcohol dehydrogenase family)